MVDLSDRRQAAARIAAQADLLDIRAIKFDAELGNGTLAGPYEVSVDLSPSFDVFQPTPSAWIIVYSFTYSVRVNGEERGADLDAIVGTNGETDEDDAAVVAKVNCTFNAAFHWHASDLPAEDEIRAFGDTSVTLALHPYLRELVHDAIARFNVGPLVMPLYKEAIRIESTTRAAVTSGSDPSGPSPRKKASPTMAVAKKTGGTKKQIGTKKKSAPKTKPPTKRSR